MLYEGAVHYIHYIQLINLYIFTHSFYEFLLRMCILETKTWKQPSRQSVLNPPSEHQGTLWWNDSACTSRNSGPILPSGKPPFVVTSGVRGAGCCQTDTRAHTDTPCPTQPQQRVADPIRSLLHSQGFLYLMQNQYLYFQDNNSNVPVEWLPNFKVKSRCSLQRNLITTHKRRSVPITQTCWNSLWKQVSWRL